MHFKNHYTAPTIDAEITADICMVDLKRERKFPRQIDRDGVQLAGGIEFHAGARAILMLWTLYKDQKAISFTLASGQPEHPDLKEIARVSIDMVSRYLVNLGILSSDATLEIVPEKARQH